MGQRNWGKKKENSIAGGKENRVTGGPRLSSANSPATYVTCAIKCLGDNESQYISNPAEQQKTKPFVTLHAFRFFDELFAFQKHYF